MSVRMDRQHVRRPPGDIITTAAMCTLPDGPRQFEEISLPIVCRCGIHKGRKPYA